MKLSINQIIFTCLIACISLFLGGCYGGYERDILIYDNTSSSGEDKVSLTFFGYKADAINLIAVESAIQGFTSQHKNIRISYEGIKGHPYWDAFEKRNSTGMLDDIFMIDHDNVIHMGLEGKLADLSDIPGLQNYTDEAIGQFTNPDGSVYFLPTAVSTYNFYINYDLLEAHGLQVPQNYADLQECCEYFVSKGITPIIANNSSALYSLIICRGLFDVYQSSDVAEQLKKFNEQPDLLVQALASGVEQTAQMLERGWMDRVEVLATNQTSDDLQLFLQGDRPFMVTGGWASVRVAAEKPSFSYGIHPYPILADGSVLAFQVDTCISINADCEALEEAKAFVRYLIQPDIMKEYCNSQASYPPLKGEDFSVDHTLAVSTEHMKNGRIVFRNDYRLVHPVESGLAACTKVLLNGGTAKEAHMALAEVLCK